MSTSTWLYAIVTLSAAFGISYFLGLAPGRSNFLKSTTITTDAATGDPKLQNGIHQLPTQDSEPVDAVEVGAEIDNRLPPLKKQCLSCGKTTETLGKAMMRCSQCKNAFYCVSCFPSTSISYQIN
jgi:hypothetical protein